MSLSAHELEHLNAVIKDAQDEAALPPEKKQRQKQRRKVTGDFDDYAADAEKAARDIIKAGRFPDGVKPSKIHNFIEKNKDRRERPPKRVKGPKAPIVEEATQEKERS